MTAFNHILHTVTTERDRFATFRIELKRRREAARLTVAEAARRTKVGGGPGISGSRWAHFERGYELKQGVRFPANPRRSTIIKLAGALHWPIRDALECAGEIEPTKAEAAQSQRNPRRELDAIIDQLSEDQIKALYRHLRAMLHPGTPDTDQSIDPDDDLTILGPPDEVENPHVERDDAGNGGQV